MESFCSASRTWKVERELGRGGQAKTFVVVDAADPTSTPHVLKLMRKRTSFPQGQSAEKQLQRFKSEVGALRALNDAGCPRIVRVVDTSLESGQPWFVMPYFAAGGMYDSARTPRYLEPYRGDIWRVLTIAADLADTLAFLHDTSPTWVHRDVKSGNIFFDTPGGAPTLGDFGLVYSPSEVGADTGVPEAIGPQAWRPPELRRGGVGKRHPGSDVYMLAGVIFEALTGGDTIDEVEHIGSHFAHEAPEYSITRFSNDARVPSVNLMLRQMFRRDPEVRLSASNVARLCRSILAWEAGTPIPQPDIATTEAEEEAAEYRSRSAAIRDESVRLELAATCERVAVHFGARQWAPLHEVTNMVDVNNGDSEPLASVTRLHPGAVWMSVRVVVSFETFGARPMLFSYILLGRLNPNVEVVGIFDDERQWTQLASGPPNAPEHLGIMVSAASSERHRLLAKLAPMIRDLRWRAPAI